VKKVVLTAAAGLVLMGALLLGSSIAAFLPGTRPGGSFGTATSCQTTTATGKLSAAEVAALAFTAGWRGADLTIAVALTMPESGADTTAVQQNEPPSLTGVGLWQLTPGTSVDLDPLTNARAAYAKYVAAGKVFTPWTTFTGGEYLQWLGWAAAGVANMSSAGLSCQAAPAASSAQTDVAAGRLGQAVEQATPPGLPSSFEGFPWGQCTFWVALHFPVAWSGNADQWWANAAAAGAPETQTPAAGDVVVYGAGDGYSDLGHVAYVVQVDPAGTFVVSEMNYVGVGLVDERTSSMAGVLGFIEP
jgi:surface antigen